jgi:hypothetical protein
VEIHGLEPLQLRDTTPENQKVDVNLLRARAQVHFLEGTATAEQLVDEIELIGFDARTSAFCMGPWFL